DVIALAHALRRVVTFPERLQQLIVGDLPGIEHHQHRFGMAGAARTNLLVSGVLGMAAGVAHGGGIDAIAEFPEFTLRAPETAEPEHRLLQTCGIGRPQLASVHEMGCCSRDRLRTARQRLGRARQCSGFAHEQHGSPPGGNAFELVTTTSVTNIYLYPDHGSPVTPTGEHKPGNAVSAVSSANNRSTACWAGTAASAEYPARPVRQ